MTKKLVLLFFLVSTLASSQQITETNTDSIYFKALGFYKTQQFEKSLNYTNRGLDLAPAYHDIRILRVRNSWALEMISNATNDIEYLLVNAIDYPGVTELAQRHLRLLKDPKVGLQFLERIEENTVINADLKILKSQYLLENKQKSESRKIALELFNDPELNEKDRYLLQNILKRTISNEIGINYQFVNFSDEYNRDNWQTISPEFQHNFNSTAVIARINYTDRVYDDGILYELEAYPVFSDKVYSFFNIGFSDGNLFPDLRLSSSIFINFLQKFELEAGGRLLHFSNQDYFSAIGGLTMYQGKFYLNTRAFIGPKRLGNLTQNYQFNVRYYLKNTDNYVFVRLGTGISPDESTIFTQVQEKPGLEAYYSNLGINFSLGTQHIVQLGGGLLKEELPSDKNGTQIIGNVSYRFRF